MKNKHGKKSQLSSSKLLSVLKYENGLKCAHLNVRSLLPKIEEVRHHIQSGALDVLCINETWLDSDVGDDLVSIPGYNIFRRDRNRHGGGVCIFVKQSHHCRLMSMVSIVESVWVEISLNKKETYIVGTIYRPPSSGTAYYDGILNDIEFVQSINEKIILLGDLNIDYSFDHSLHSNPIHLIEHTYNMKQLVLQPTRVTATTSSLIDVILTTVADDHVKTGVVDLSLSDHKLIYTIIATAKNVNISITIYGIDPIRISTRVIFYLMLKLCYMRKMNILRIIMKKILIFYGISSSLVLLPSVINMLESKFNA